MEDLSVRKIGIECRDLDLVRWQTYKQKFVTRGKWDHVPISDRIWKNAQKQLWTFSQNAEGKVRPSLLTNPNFFAIIGSSKHYKCVCKGKQAPMVGFQRVPVWCEGITSAEDNSSPEQFRRIFKLYGRRRKRVSPVTEKPRWKRRGKADNGSLSKRVVPRVSYNFVSFAEDFLLQRGFFILPKDRGDARRKDFYYARIRKIHKTIFPRGIFFRLGEENISR